MNWNHVNGGAVGYLHRCYEQLRFAGVRNDDEEQARDVLGNEVYENMLEAARYIMQHPYAAQDDRPEQTL